MLLDYKLPVELIVLPDISPYWQMHKLLIYPRLPTNKTMDSYLGLV